MKHRLLYTAVIVMMVLALFAGCTVSAPPQPTPQPQQAGKLNIVALKGPTGMGLAQLMQRNEQGTSAVKYAFTLASAPDEISGKLLTGEADIAAAPINLAAALYNKTEGDVRIIGINTLGVLYVLENGNEVQSIADLAGKTLYATGEGATPQYVLNYLLDKNGLSGQVDVQYMGDHAELATLLAADEGGVSIAMLPEPNVSVALQKNASLRVALDLTQEWDKISGGKLLVQGCFIARREVVENNPGDVLAFLREYAASAEFVNQNPEQAAQLIALYGILPGAAAAKAAIPNCNIVSVTGRDMREQAQAMLQVLFEADAKSVGGKMPETEFYFDYEP